MDSHAKGRQFFCKPEVDTWLAQKREQHGFQKAFAALDANVKAVS